MKSFLERIREFNEGDILQYDPSKRRKISRLERRKEDEERISNTPNVWVDPKLRIRALIQNIKLDPSRANESRDDYNPEDEPDLTFDPYDKEDRRLIRDRERNISPGNNRPSFTRYRKFNKYNFYNGKIRESVINMTDHRKWDSKMAGPDDISHFARVAIAKRKKPTANKDNVVKLKRESFLKHMVGTLNEMRTSFPKDTSRTYFRSFRTGAGMVVNATDMSYPFRVRTKGGGSYLTTVPPGGPGKHGHHGNRGRNPIRAGFKHTKISRGASHAAD